MIADGGVQLAWDPAPDPNVIGYKVYYGTASGEYTSAVTVGSVPNATILGLREGIYYFFAVLAFNALGVQSDFSVEVSQFIPVTSKSETAFAPVGGAYNGLFFETNQILQTGAGAFSLYVNAGGAYSGHLQSSGTRGSFSGRLDPWCRAKNVVAGPNNKSFIVQFRIGGDGQLTHLLGQVSDSLTVSSLAAVRAFYDGRTLLAPFSGRYTCVLPGQGTDPSAPQGYGFGVVQVTTSGLAMLAGTLADSTHISQSAPVSQSGLWPFYAPLYSGEGSAISWLIFTNQVNDDLNGVMNWIKPTMQNTRYYSSGFTNQLQAIGSRYSIPSPITVPVLNLASTSIAFTGGELGSGFTNAIDIGRSSRVTNRSSNFLDMTFSIGTGTFCGNVADPLSNRKMPFSGVAFQKNNTSYGLLFGTNQTSSVLLGL